MASAPNNAAPVVARMLDAGGGGRRWADDRRVTSPGVLHAQAATIGMRATHWTINNPLGVRIHESLVANLIGAGIKPRSEHPSETMRRNLHARFSAWTDHADAEGAVDFFGLQQAALADMARFGEALFTIEAEPLTGAPQLRRLHPEQLDRGVTRRTDAGGFIHLGVEFDRTGRIVAYWLRPIAPGEAAAGSALAAVRWPAADIIHVFRRLLPGQIRGISWYASALLSAKELEELLDALLVRTKVAALHAGFLTHQAEESYAGGEQTGQALDVSLEPGALVVTPSGYKPEFPDVPDQGAASPLLTSTLRMIAAGAGVPYEAATGDYSNVNYSSARQAHLEFRRFAEGIQHHQIAFGFCRPVWARFVRWLVLSGVVGATTFQRDRPLFEAVKWLPPAWPWVDPKNDAEAAEIALRSNLRSRSEITAERGYDVEDLDAEIAADAARLARLGVLSPAPQETREAPIGETAIRAAFSPSSIDEKARTVELIASTGAGVVRHDFEGPFVEMLEVTARALDLSRLEGMPLLDAHRQTSLKDILGVVTGARIEAGKLIVAVKISARAEEYWSDIKAGIIGNVSVGYAPLDWKDGTNAKGERVRTVTRWELREVSLVPVGADPSARIRSS